MDFTEIENSIWISNPRTICEAAEDLNITQSALNQQLLRLENEIGIKIFQRSKNGLSVTEAGDKYLEYAHKLVNLKNEMISVLGDYAEYKTGIIRIGMPVIRGLEMFTELFPEFHNKYPHIKLEAVELGYARRLQMLQKNELDLIFITLPKDRMKEHVYYSLLEEEIFVAIRKESPILNRINTDEDLDLSILKNEKFVFMSKGTTLREITNNLFSKAGIHPKIVLETSSYQTVSSIVKNGEICGITPRLNIQDNDSLVFLHIKGRPSRYFCAVHSKSLYMSKPIKDFLDLTISYWRKK